MVGIELVRDQQAKTPFSVRDRIGHRVSMAARTLGLLIRPVGNTLILMPPLSATVKELKQMVDIVKIAISVVRESSSSKNNTLTATPS